jgi:hypothetical protein
MSLKSEMFTGRNEHGIIRINDLVFCAGGWNGQGNLKSLEIYYIENDLWQDGPDMCVSKNGLTLTNIKDRFIYSFGGNSEGI